ncbi:neprilysin-4-like [Cimex lectularius]|uniref:Endothelin-converting enzyme n=1 Tax=Cimex lectularius TaxID=79782 RepID=A0A8I6RXI3_CIMLE|nr:neprilysin-4-like [Cimex lectularius]
MLWESVPHLIILLDDRFILEFNRHYGTQVLLSSALREYGCFNDVNSHMPFATVDIMYRAYLDNHTENDIALLGKYIQQAFIEELSKTSWLSEKTRQSTRNKIYEMELTIEYADEQFREKQLDNLYKDVDFQTGTYFENCMNIIKYLIGNMKKQLREPDDNYEANPIIINAFYNYDLNKIIILIGLLQPPVYHKHLPKCINFGGLGNLIGHEATHGFTLEGLEFDKIIEKKWEWDIATIEAFNEKAQCFIEQYKNFTTELGINIEKVVSLTENIADSGGIKKTFLAYKNWSKSHNNSDETLPGMSYTPGQLFFLTFAQMKCESISPDLYSKKLLYNKHAPSKYRITSTLQNSEDFANEFNCPPGSRMNPTTKCSI